MKPAAQAKTRLAPSLDPDQRATLTWNMLKIVLHAATSSSLIDVVVVGGDSEIRVIAEAGNSNWRPDKGRGLNGELSAQVQINSSNSAASMYIPGDLPLLTTADVEQALDSSKFGSLLTICPAVGDGGTNGLVVPAQSPFRIQLGTDSFYRHTTSAEQGGLPFAIVETQGFGLDLDTSGDLAELRRIAPGVFERILRPGDKNCN